MGVSSISTYMTCLYSSVTRRNHFLVGMRPILTDRSQCCSVHNCYSTRSRRCKSIRGERRREGGKIDEEIIEGGKKVVGMSGESIKATDKQRRNNVWGVMTEKLRELSEYMSVTALM